MATVLDHLTSDGFDAWIVVDGAKTPQYGVEHKEGEHTVSCWISSETDKEFSISFCRQRHEQYDYCATVKLDGHRVAYTLYKNSDCTPSTTAYTISRVRTSLTEVRNFVFASLELTDDDVHLEDPSSQNIGEVSIVIQRVTTLFPSTTLTRVYAVPTDGGKVHERSKKGLAHQIKFSSSKAKLPSNTIDQTYRVQPYGAAITFIFKYRPLAMLQATGIAPRRSPVSENEPPRHLIPTIDMLAKRKDSVVKIEIDDDDDESEGKEDEDLAKERELLTRKARRKRPIQEENQIGTENLLYARRGHRFDLNTSMNGVNQVNDSSFSGLVMPE